jgi:hypothetical protein
MDGSNFGGTMTFKQWKTRFHKEISASDIKVDWDSGHAYHYLDSHPACEAPEDLEDECEDYKSEFMMEYGPNLYCVPHIDELADSYDRVACGCDCPPYGHKDEMVDYVECYIALQKQQQPPRDNTFITKLEQWVMIKKLAL